MPSRPNVRRLLTSILLLIITLMSPSAGALAAQSTPTPVAVDKLPAVQPEWRDEAQNALDRASAKYTITAEVQLPSERGSQATIHGSQIMTYTNTTGEPIATLPFRLYANGPDAERDALQVLNVQLDGAAVTPELTDDGSTASIALITPLAPGEGVTVRMDFTTTVPVDERDHYGIFNIDPESGTWALAHWYPILAGWDPDRGWVLDPPSENGDPIFSTTASYNLTLDTPVGWRVVSTGIEVASRQSGPVTERRIVTGPVRDLTLVLDDDLDRLEQEVDGTTITSWYNPGEERTGQAVLDYATQSLSYFNDLIGPYPYTTLELAPVDLFGAAGVEFPQLIYMGASYYESDQTLEVPNSLDFTVAHEVVHQWFYGLVGSNQYDHAFIDEGLTNFLSSTVYFTEIYSPRAGRIMTERYLEAPFESNVTNGNDQIVNTPTDDFSSSGAYVFAAYSKAPVGFKAIYDEIGHDTFAAALQQYYAEHRFTIASPEELLTAFEDAADRQLDELWNHWFEEAAGEEDV